MPPTAAAPMPPLPPDPAAAMPPTPTAAMPSLPQDPMPPVPPATAAGLPPLPQDPVPVAPPTPAAAMPTSDAPTPPVIAPPTLQPSVATPATGATSASPAPQSNPAGQWQLGDAAPPVVGIEQIDEAPVAPEAPGPGKGPWIAAVVGALVLLLGGGFFAFSALGASGGADSPEQAVDELLDALNNEDFITMAELLEPGERRAVAEPVITEVLPELVRLGVFDETVDAGNVEGIDFEFTDVTYRVDALADHPDLVHVYFTGGEAASELTAAELPLGDAFREFLGDDLTDEPREVEDLEEVESPIVLVERDGRWYFSAIFTLTENARLDIDRPLPLASESPAALGAQTPAAAVQGFFEELNEFDLGGIIGRMDPDEMAALYRYSPLFLEDGQAALDDARAEIERQGVTWNITNLDLESTLEGDEAVVELSLIHI